MAYARSVVNLNAVINAVPADGFDNGTDYVNAAMPATTHVRAISRWPLVQAADGTLTMEPVDAAIAIYAAATGDAAARNAVPDDEKMTAEEAVVMATVRAAATRYFNLAGGSLNAAETTVRLAAANVPDVHADHQAAVTAAIAQWALPAARWIGLAFYVSISFETVRHHHLPAKTKKLWHTTSELLGLKEWVRGNARREGIFAHDMFHPLSDALKSQLARAPSSKVALVNLKLGNLARRIPVKAPDCALALNYPVLATKAFGYAHTPDLLPSGLRPVAAHLALIAEYEQAADPNDVARTVGRLQQLSVGVAEASAYLVGFVLGKDARSTENPDLTLSEAAETNTILGSPAYARVASDYPGTFAEGKRRGYIVMSRWAQQTATDGLAPRLAGVVASLGIGGRQSATAVAAAVTERDDHRAAERAAVEAARAAAAAAGGAAAGAH